MQRLIDFTNQFLNISLSVDQIHSFEIYLRELIQWNEKVNLTAINNPDEIITKHFIDSLTCSLVSDFSKPGNLIDIGTGAGFPGLPLKIIYPHIELNLVDSVGKKIEFCQYLSELLGLKDVNFTIGRAEELGQNLQHREKYHWATARAVAALPVLAEYLLPLIKINGTAIIHKGKNAQSEIDSAKNAVIRLGGTIGKIKPIQIPGLDERILISLIKTRPTPMKYPRRVGIPAKRPLV